MKYLKNWDNKTWISSYKYISSFHKFLKLKTKINKDTHVLDIGCGRAKIISFLHKKYKFNKKPIGIDIVKNKNIKKNIIFKKIDAIKYLKNTNKIFNLILIKQTVHFFTKKQINILLKLAKMRLNKNGQILILSLKNKKNEIPCFRIMKSKLMISLKREEILMKEIKKNLKKFKNSYFKFKVNISKSNYIKMLKKRYISCLLNISNKEISEGVSEIKKKYKKQINFFDTLNCIIFTK
ncbi:MAG: methyltransferase domain-containing protein [Pelagibacteraceae bacterium]